MKRSSALLLALSLLTFAIAASPTYGPSATLAAQSPLTDPEWTRHRLVAHGMGEISGYTYTNTLEAFKSNYADGYRLFEVDLQLTADGYLVTRHDWQPYLYGLLGQIPPEAGRRGLPLTRAEALSLLVHHAYQTLDFEGLLNLLRQYPDAVFITDTKDTDPAIVRRQFRAMKEAAEHEPELLSRVVPQFYDQTMYAAIESVHKFDSYIYTLYMSPDTESQTLSFVRDHPRVAAVTMPESMAQADFLQRLEQAGVHAYIHTINDTAAMIRYMDQGAHGFYTDRINERQLASAKAPPPSYWTLLAKAARQIYAERAASLWPQAWF
ncbi:phosphatidylinositol-specific phospholipase C/glycerophosphodiester phosphodiesterase family protein [Paenibacillus methanolicus]|uniref:Glycerophosphoryl diester phosphodiesterase n=1 Tax=Paenibacillus methanolicus TaxID=582686 RepID=A0A5S5BPR7_9BACL|nr:phosphatidylinositol-specific phospholipase C/glycerophosphodiester phosphodiesterase family protein [Paenibacillus methanolicus]TYP68987.1 glycerophosphoryl diester phosphodiesterase [Paenibacillus methanolicus]